MCCNAGKASLARRAPASCGQARSGSVWHGRRRDAPRGDARLRVAGNRNAGCAGLRTVRLRIARSGLVMHSINRQEPHLRATSVSPVSSFRIEPLTC